MSIDYGPVYVTEGNTGSVTATFRVTLSAPPAGVTISP